MLSHFGVSLTTSFTPEQRKRIDEVLDPIITTALKQIKTSSYEIQDMDKRPHKTYSPTNPDVFFPYVRQAMLEDLIAYLQYWV